MQWASSVTEENEFGHAVAVAAAEVSRQLSAPPDLVICFVSAHHEERYEALPELLSEWFPGSIQFGCSGGGIIGGGQEVEQGAGLSLTAACLPGVEITPFHIEQHYIPDLYANTSAWKEMVGIAAGETADFLLIAEPFSFETEPFLMLADRAFPASAKIGGVASGGRRRGTHAMYLGQRVYRTGLIGLALSGNLAMDTIVAQGCRPIGEPMFVTRCKGNLIHELDGQSPQELLLHLYRRLERRDRELFQNSLYLGVAMRESRTEYHRGDFLIRNILGSESESDALVVGTVLAPNTVVQFHLRDARTSAEDLEQALRDLSGEHHTQEASLVFACLGRGKSLYGEPDHDSRALRRHLGDIPVGGFFCNGEIGPVQGTTFLHGYTSAVALFRSKDN